MKIKLSVQTWINLEKEYNKAIILVDQGYIKDIQSFFEYLSEQEIDIGIPEAIAKD